jgi:hypothetical protein
MTCGSFQLTDRLEPLQKKRNGFRQKAEPFNNKRHAALCRDAATADGWFSERSSYYLLIQLVMVA